MKFLKLTTLLLSLCFIGQLFALTSGSNIYNVVDQYTKDNGLPVNAVTDLAIDKDGFLWVATHDGLLRFDGLSFKLLNTDNYPDMPSNRIRSIEAFDTGGLLVLFGSNQLYLFDNATFSKVADVTLDAYDKTKNQLWYGTNLGLFVYDISTNQSQQIISETNITSLTLNKSGVFYADENCTIHFYSFQSGTSTLYSTLDCQKISQMDSNNHKLAVSTDSGAFVIDGKTKQYLQGKQIIKIAWIKDHVYTLGNALHVINTKNDTLSEISKPDATIIYLDPPAQMMNNGAVWVNAFSTLWVDDEVAFKAPSAIFKHIHDKHGGLWVATKGDGLFYLRKPIIKTLGLSENQLNTGFVTGIMKASEGDYLARESTDLYRFNPKTEIWHKFKNISFVNTFLYDSSGNLWVSQNGLCRMDQHKVCHKQPYPVSSFTDIQLLFEDSKGQIWVGSDEGLFVYSNEKWQLINSRKSNFVFAQEIPKQGVFLASSEYGISVFENNADIKEIEEIDSDYGLPTNRIRTLYYEPKITPDALLIGTVDKGLCLWHFKEGLRRCASTAEGLPHYGIHRILADKKERLWFSSNNGIYTIKIKDLRNYFDDKMDFLPSHRFGKNDGMADSEANGGVQNSGTIGYQGDLWFPTQKGIVRVPANDLILEKIPLTAYFKDIVVNGKPRDAKHQSVTLEDPNHRELTLSLSTIALGMADGVQFRYRLKPSSNWNVIDKGQEISFNALSPGKHTLSFQAARHGHWIGPTTQLAVDVKPTLFETHWFRAILIAFSFLILFWWIKKLTTKKDKLEIEVNNRTSQLRTALKTISTQKERIKQEASLKQQHFLDLSHELRTPLTLVMGPLQGEAPIEPDTRHMMAKNSQRLLHLINQMLKLEQLDIFDTKVTFTAVALVSRCRLILDQFEHNIKQHGFILEFKEPETEIHIEGITEQIDTLISNLLSNALKFTPAEGIIQVTIQQEGNGYAVLVIEDSGPGIAEQQRKQVFHRFVRLNHEQIPGSGLGLSIVKKIVQRHGGKIVIKDSRLGGAQFRVSLPIAETKKQIEKKTEPSTKQTILVVDDNMDILHYIESILSPKYQVITTQSATECLKMASRMHPDLLIVDIGMPDMNGFELVAAMKKNTETKQIPIIFATARAHPNDQIQAIETGGDAFISKPFSAEQLQAYVNRFLVTKSLKTEEPITQDPQQRSLLARAQAVIKDNISNAAFGVEELAAELAMSRSALYRKLKNEVDTSPADVITRYRMERADTLLRTTNLSISKITDMTGYKQISTFNRSFNRYYGHNPTDHRDKA